MWKFVFWVYAFLLIEAVCVLGRIKSPQRRDSLAYVEEKKNKLIDNIDRDIKKINHKVKEIPGATSENAKKLRVKAVNVAESDYSKIISIQKKVNFEIEKVLNETVDVDLTVCTEMALAFFIERLDALEETRRCLSNTIKVSDSYIENITNKANVVLKNLTSIKNEAENCVEDIDNIKPLSNALQCVNQVSKKSTYAAKKEVTFFQLEIGKLNMKILDLMSKLKTCSTLNGFKKTKEDSSSIFIKVKSCIKTQKAIAE